MCWGRLECFEVFPEFDVALVWMFRRRRVLASNSAPASVVWSFFLWDSEYSFTEI